MTWWNLTEVVEWQSNKNQFCGILMNIQYGDNADRVIKDGLDRRDRLIF